MRQGRGHATRTAPRASHVPDVPRHAGATFASVGAQGALSRITKRHREIDLCPPARHRVRLAGSANLSGDRAETAYRPWTVEARCPARRSEEHTSELQSLMRISYAVFCLKKKIKKQIYTTTNENYINEEHKTPHTE